MKLDYSKAKYIVLGCCLSIQLSAHADSRAGPDFVLAADRIFSEADSADKPALAVALLQDGKVIYEKAFGSVNLEYKIPATVDTKFQVDALAWEFIAFATLMLEEQGKIKLNDDIRKYLPELPDFGERVTIDHLLQSTDGLPGYKVLKALAKWEMRGAEQHKAILQLIQHQKKLNFKPGSAFSPGGDTRLILLAKIVEAASGLSFDAYCKTHIFSPLGMRNTLFVHDSTVSLGNTAVPYLNDGKGEYKQDHGGGNAAGPSNLYTSIKDLALWRSNMSSHAVFKKSLMDKLNVPIRLDSGKIIKDISSISTYGQQHAGKERGIPKIYQMGNFGGYASSIFHFPEQKITAVTLSSGLAYNGSYGMRAAAILLESQFTEPEKIDYNKIARVEPNPGEFQKYVGNYWSPSRAIATKIHIKNDHLHYTRTEGSEGRELIYLGNARFQMKIEGDDEYIVQFVGQGAAKDMHFSMAGSDPVVFESYQPASYSEKELAQFSGVFYARVIDSSFVLDVHQGMLVANNMRTGTINFKPVTADLFSGNKDFMAGIKFNRGDNDEITGFHVMVDEVRYLEFTKMRVAAERRLPL